MNFLFAIHFLWLAMSDAALRIAALRTAVSGETTEYPTSPDEILMMKRLTAE